MKKVSIKINTVNCVFDTSVTRIAKNILKVKNNYFKIDTIISRLIPDK